VVVCHSSTDLQPFDETSTLAGEGILEGFTLAVSSLFAV
jgi:hypothetical protein